jgi:hypothetical protein
MTSFSMKTNNDIKSSAWRKSLNDLPWAPNRVEQTTLLALSRAAWLWVQREAAIQAVTEVAPLGIFDNEPHVLFQIWQSVSAQIAQPDMFELLTA